MEHDRKLKQRDELDELLGVEEAQPDFENFLKRKAETWKADPITNLSELEILESLEHPLPKAESKSAPDAEASSDTTSDSTGIVETGNLESLPFALGADGRTTELQVHTHPIVGTYITEVVADAKVDEDWKRTYIKTYEIAVVEMTPEQVIHKFHELERMIYLMRAQQQALRGPVLEQLLRAETAQERERLLDLDRKERNKSQKRAKGEVKPKKAASGVTKPSSKTGKSKLQKSIDTLHGLGMTRIATEAKLRASNMWDDSLVSYLDSLFGK